MKYYVKIHVDKVLHFEVEAASKEEAINKVYYGGTEPYDADVLDTKVDECCPVETVGKEHFEKLTKGWHRGKKKFEIGKVYKNENGDCITISDMDVDDLGGIRAKCHLNSEMYGEWLYVQIYDEYELIQPEIYKQKQRFRWYSYQEIRKGGTK